MGRRSLMVFMALLALGGCTSMSSPTPVAPRDTRPNIVFVLTDDLTESLLAYMPQVRAMRRAGTSFTNYTVTDSLCCPSRASMLTGKFPHNTGVFTNSGPDGGLGAFNRHGNHRSTFATDLQSAGYRTALMGKYLNRYHPRAGQAVPPGWSEWAVAGSAYSQYDYDLAENDRIVHYGHRPADYLTDVISRKAQSFITRSAASGSPFLLEVATYAPHSPYTPAPRDARRFPGLKAPRNRAFDVLPTGAPAWLAARTPLTAANQARLDAVHRLRAQSVLSVDRMIGALRVSLARAGVAGNTLLVFASDNGYHLGEHRLRPGKQTAFDHDVRVPLVVSGPGVRAGARVTRPTENIDLRPTFGDFAGARVPDDVDGRSLRPLLAGTVPRDWKTAALIEHHGPDADRADPDYAPASSGNPRTYVAIRTADYTYIEYNDGFREFYDRRIDPYQLRNTASRLRPATAAALHARLKALTLS
ncbi:sulfatase [Actinoplanes sp. NPDC051494]|uniref:sulfatase n=1 Tax=Actinoplanes sp. NPDC051494 TaxID=3363907 RepID=UPI0037B6E946